jgi:hypothetical protein
MAFVRSAYTHTDLLKHALIGFEQGKQEIDQAIANIRQTLNGTAARAPSVNQHVRARYHERRSPQTDVHTDEATLGRAKKVGKKRLV